MKVWIVAKTRARRSIGVHGLTEENQNVRLLRPNGFYPSAQTRFEVGQIWDLELTPSPYCIPPHVEDVLVKKWRYLGIESNLYAVLLERTNPWRGGPDQLFAGHLRWVMKTNNAFISERHSFAHISMGYWLPDAPLIKWHNAKDRVCYRYVTPARELITDYAGMAQPLFTVPAQTLVHVALHPWWTPSNRWAPNKDSQVERRCYLYIAGWYL